ncbi:MAG: OmpH family outer membrane protein [Pseudomonadota bacterium]
MRRSISASRSARGSEPGREAARALRAAGAALALALGAAAGAAGQEAGDAAPRAEAAPAVLVVNREAVVERSAPAQALRQMERRIRERVQSELDRVKAELETEEQRLTELKETLPAEEFAERARAFDQRVREERRAAQERRALVLRFFKDARNALASAVPRVLDGLRRETGALAILDEGAVLSADPALDVTEQAVARFNAEMGEVRFDPPEELLPE